MSLSIVQTTVATSETVVLGDAHVHWDIQESTAQSCHVLETVLTALTAVSVTRYLIDVCAKLIMAGWIVNNRHKIMDR